MKTFDADNFSGNNHDGRDPNKPLKFLATTSIIGDKILNLYGEELGTIKDIMIDVGKGKIEYVVMETGGFLGMGEKYFALPYGLLKVDPKNESFILDQVNETLKNAPGFDKDHWPETNSHTYRTSSSYWGGFMGSNTGSAY